ncbi:MAG TPA: PorV/PorQ family protein, partial [Rhodothermales bacterium]|nr:PorV/PorQ family protein [Rhodothermales bacterium]
MRRPLFLCLLAALTAVPALRAQSVGTFSFLRLDAAPRSAALAGTLDAIPTDDPAVVFANPALITDRTAGGLGLTYTNHLSDVKAGTLAYGRSVLGFDAVAGLRYLSFGEMTEADETGQVTGSFGASSLALTVGASRAQGSRLRVGGALSLVTSGVADARATALAADAGIALLLPDRLTVSATVRNAGVTLASLGTTKDELPLDVRVGVSKRLAHLPLQLSVTGYDLHRPGE